MMKHLSLALIFGVFAMIQPVPKVVAAQSTPLTPFEQAILHHLENRDTSFTVVERGTHYEAPGAALHQALNSDNYLNHDYRKVSWQYTTTGTTTSVVFSLNYYETRAQVQYVETRVRAILLHILSPGMNEFQREQAVHDYIILHVAYDTTLRDVTPYTALALGKTVCNGYAMLTYLMLTEAGLKNHIVDGQVFGASSGAHAWNSVLLYGHWYNLDTTWDDPVPDVRGRLRYDYFNLTDAELRRDHSWNPASAMPATTDFVSTLAHGVGGRAADQRILRSTQLYLETPAYTLHAPAQVLNMWTAAHHGTILFRYPGKSLVDLENHLSIASFSIVSRPDQRDPAYVIITLS